MTKSEALVEYERLALELDFIKKQMAILRAQLVGIDESGRKRKRT